MKTTQRQRVLLCLLAASATAVAWDRWGHAGAASAVISEAAPRRAPLVAATSSNGSGDSPDAAARAAAVVPGLGAGSGAIPQALAGQILALRGREAYQKAGGDVFPSLAPNVPAPLPAGAPAEPVKPSAPALPFTVIGKKLEAGTWEVFLARGDQTLVASVGSTLGTDYRVTAITATQMSLVYLPLQENQTLPIGAAFND